MTTVHGRSVVGNTCVNVIRINGLIIFTADRAKSVTFTVLTKFVKCKVKKTAISPGGNFVTSTPCKENCPDIQFYEDWTKHGFNTAVLDELRHLPGGHVMHSSEHFEN
ncbi:hypothetical protein DPMN_031524 [Dreissena polymorpha]|uniref:Uncharacterized protein n=1 Tax=Dreissena polymorpha TaxID=45954 RepID=A0A9D4RHE9_DREPO|nr:hypothetical protein DPMN_031524 [Dreissena polymorpha]